jgi:cupin 2 domain-containing protein
MLPVRNLFRDAGMGNSEVTQVLASAENLRLEHLVSNGEPSPPGFWYDQPEDEWVVLLRGSATLVFEGDSSLELCAGDSLTIPARRKHRVERVSQDAVWVALHFNAV